MDGMEDTPIGRLLQCCVCHEARVSYQLCANGHIACRMCAGVLAARRDLCPLCRAKLLDPPPRNLIALQIARELPGVAVDACPWCELLMPCDDVASHASACDERRVTCERCRASFAVADLAGHCGARCEFGCAEGVPCGLEEQHRRVCTCRPVVCPTPGCAVRLSFRSLDFHVKTCAFVCVPCPNPMCAERPTRAQLAAHMARCDFACVPCLNQGCAERPMRPRAAEHAATCAFARVPCLHPGCAEFMQRRDLAVHVAACGFAPGKPAHLMRSSRLNADAYFRLQARKNVAAACRAACLEGYCMIRESDRQCGRPYNTRLHHPCALVLGRR